MPTLIAGIVAVALLYVALNVIKGADPKWLAKIVRTRAVWMRAYAVMQARRALSAR